MIPTSFDYQRATSIDDALAQLQAAGEGAKFLAGGHSLVPLMKLRMSEPTGLVDIARIPELAGIRAVDGAIEIGAGTTHADVAASALLRERCPVIAEAAAEIGDPQVRNRGTLGGSLAHADPAADYPPVILALDAEIHVRGLNGSRTIKASEFFRDLFTVDLQEGELITHVRFAPANAAAYAKLHQRASHFAIVGVAAVIEVARGRFQSARLALTGACSYAQRLTSVEQGLVGRPATAATVEAAVGDAGAGLVDVNSDIHASAEYRRAMVPVFARRALTRALERAS
ncbi:MAG: xanthine dehydrogenase family protein subunit M [Acidobacteriota bacterium]